MENAPQRRLTREKWTALAVLALGLTILGADKSPATRALQRFLSRGQTSAVTSNDVARGWREAGSDAGGPVVMPAGAVTNDLLRRRGGFDWAFRVEPEGWRFPYRDDALDGVTVFACGEVRPDVGTLYFPIPITNGVSLLPEARWGLLPNGGASVFSHAVTTNGSLLLDWRNALVGRDPNAPTNLQMELFHDGSFAWRTDGGSTSYLPVLPFDYDGDGLENSVAPEPLVPNSVDAHGTPPEWYRIVCSNVFTTADNSNISLRPEVNTNAYYFVDVVATTGPAPIYFAADRDSRLGSPVVVARAGETNRVPLLIGVEYAVTSTVPFSVTVPEGGFAEANQLNERNCLVKWPLEFEFAPDSAGGYVVNVIPCDPGGTFTWTSTAPGGRAMLLSSVSSPFCSCWSGYGPWVSFSCTETCGCNGDCRATGEYSFEDARFSVSGGSCRCGFDDPHPEEEPSYEPTDGPSFSIKFSKDAVIFEDGYDDSPGMRKPKRSTRVRLTVSAYGGPNGGTFILAPRNLGKLAEVAEGPIDLPSSRTLAAEESFYSTCIYEAETESGSADDISVAGYFIDAGGGMRNANAALTSVKIEISSIVSMTGAPHRHRWGVGERFYCEWTPALPDIQIIPHNACEKEGTYALREDFVCPMESTAGIIQVKIGDESYMPATQVLMPSHIEVREGEELHFPVMAGYPGGVGFAMDLHVMPDTVSFRALEFIEQPSDDSIVEDYFLNPNLSALWYHDEDKGAGVWRSIQNENFWFHDVASMGDQLPLPCSRGRIVWNIPVEWREKDDVDSPLRRLAVVPQSFVMAADGTLRVSKYRYWAERSPSGTRCKSEGVR
ncbi:MAG: hypothetical protein ACI4UY_07845 [Kiritimatiellia bacterium]